MSKNIMVRTLMASILILILFAQTPLATAQTSTPEVPAKPDTDQVITQLNATATTDPEPEALARQVAQEYGTQFGAQYTEANVFLLPSGIEFEDVTALYEQIFVEAGWESEVLASKTMDTSGVAAWSNDHAVFLVYLEPPTQTRKASVLVTVDMLALPNPEGTQALDSGNNPELAALAEQMAANIAQKTGATTHVNIMTFPATITPEAMVNFYKQGMKQAGWTSEKAFSQSNEQFSSMGWMQDNHLLLMYVMPASKQTANQNLLLWISAELPVDQEEVAATATP